MITKENYSAVVDYIRNLIAVESRRVYSLREERKLKDILFNVNVASTNERVQAGRQHDKLKDNPSQLARFYHSLVVGMYAKKTAIEKAELDTICNVLDIIPNEFAITPEEYKAINEVCAIAAWAHGVYAKGIRPIPPKNYTTTKAISDLVLSNTDYRYALYLQATAQRDNKDIQARYLNDMITDYILSLDEHEQFTYMMVGWLSGDHLEYFKCQ